jgi:hypothetical protein
MPIINNIQPVEPFVPHLLVENYGKNNVENSRIGRSGMAGLLLPQPTSSDQEPSELFGARTPTKRDSVASQHFRPLGSQVQAAQWPFQIHGERHWANRAE